MHIAGMYYVSSYKHRQHLCGGVGAAWAEHLQQVEVIVAALVADDEARYAHDLHELYVLHLQGAGRWLSHASGMSVSVLSRVCSSVQRFGGTSSKQPLCG